jgi:hypothetical protein
MMMVEFVCDAESMAIGVRHWCSHYLFADECLKRMHAQKPFISRYRMYVPQLLPRRKMGVCHRMVHLAEPKARVENKR